MPAPKRVVTLDLLRGIAALSVAIPHFLMNRSVATRPSEQVSIIAVEVFFVLSGFVLAPQLKLCLSESGPRIKHLLVFFCRRWVRTLIPFFVALLALSVFTENLFTSDFVRYLFFVRSFLSVQDAGDYFAPAWSLAIEEWFYVVFPLFIGGAAALLAKWRPSPYALAGVFLLGMLGLKLFWAFHYEGPKVDLRRISLFRLDSICFGFLLTYVFSSAAIREAFRRYRWTISLLLLLTNLATAYVLGILLDDSPSVANAISFTYLAPIFGSSLIALLCLWEEDVARWRLLEPVADFLGKTSYTVYLFHMLFIALLMRGPAFSLGTALTLYLSALLAFCYLHFQFVERPALKLRPDYRESFSLTDLLRSSPRK
jgi:peptidoglycan/LPS O-acetylase OafA/YrhL